MRNDANTPTHDQDEDKRRQEEKKSETATEPSEPTELGRHAAADIDVDDEKRPKDLDEKK